LRRTKSIGQTEVLSLGGSPSPKTTPDESPKVQIAGVKAAFLLSTR
jgi:hypothetical protein